VFGVGLDLLLLVTLRYAAQQERRTERESSASMPAVAARRAKPREVSPA
jgi:hypothetical protein